MYQLHSLDIDHRPKLVWSSVNFWRAFNLVSLEQVLSIVQICFTLFLERLNVGKVNQYYFNNKCITSSMAYNASYDAVNHYLAHHLKKQESAQKWWWHRRGVRWWWEWWWSSSIAVSDSPHMTPAHHSLMELANCWIFCFCWLAAFCDVSFQTASSHELLTFLSMWILPAVTNTNVFLHEDHVFMISHMSAICNGQMSIILHFIIWRRYNLRLFEWSHTPLLTRINDFSKADVLLFLRDPHCTDWRHLNVKFRVSAVAEGI